MRPRLRTGSGGWQQPWVDTDSERRERLLGRARELITEAGFKIGMSDGGNVTEAKPDIKWDKVERSC